MFSCESASSWKVSPYLLTKGPESFIHVWPLVIDGNWCASPSSSLLLLGPLNDVMASELCSKWKRRKLQNLFKHKLWNFLCDVSYILLAKVSHKDSFELKIYYNKSIKNLRLYKIYFFSCLTTIIYNPTCNTFILFQGF